MRILLVSLNARYVHTNLAVRYLREEVKRENKHNRCEVRVREFTINEQLDKIAGEIYEEKPDVLGFSCYIWNITETLALIRRLRPVMPQARIFAGGPEVSFDAKGLLSGYPELDAVIIGEGEKVVPRLLEVWARGGEPWEVDNIVWRQKREGVKGEIPEGKWDLIEDSHGFIVTNPYRPVYSDLNDLPNPYEEEEDFSGRLVYVETSRGCPYNCQFCISSTFRGVRFLNPEKFRLILRRLFHCGARTIKFVDRTFNANKRHAFSILDIFREEAERFTKEGKRGSPDNRLELRAHCEMAGELLDEEWLAYLKSYPAGMIQLEIGVQSTHRPTLEIIRRPQHFDLWKEKVWQLQHLYNIPVYLDLIAGLPGEGWEEFRKSFNDVYEVRPNHLQLGFLKVLKGSGIWEKSREYGITFAPDPPYTVLETKELSHAEILKLNRIEEIMEKYYNSGKFRYSLEYILPFFRSPFDFYSSLAEYWHKNGWFKQAWKHKALFEKLWDFLQFYLEGNRDLPAGEPGYFEEKGRIAAIWREALRFDYFCLERPGEVPSYLQLCPEEKGEEAVKVGRNNSRKGDHIRCDSRWQDLIPEFRQMDKRQWARATAVEYFSFDVAGSLGLNGPPADILALVPGEGCWYLFYYGKDRKFFKYH